MASVDYQLIEEVTAHAQSDYLEDARVICTDGTYFPNNLRTWNLCYNICYNICVSLMINGKVKVHPRTRQEGPEGE